MRLIFESFCEGVKKSSPFFAHVFEIFYFEVIEFFHHVDVVVVNTVFHEAWHFLQLVHDFVGIQGLDTFNDDFGQTEILAQEFDETVAETVAWIRIVLAELR